MTRPKKHPIEHAALWFWVAAILVSLYLFFFKGDELHEFISKPFSASFLGYALFLGILAVRGLTLIPATYIIILGMFFFRPWPLYVMSVIGAVVSAALIYKFASSWHLYSFFERSHSKKIRKISEFLRRNETAIVILWIVFPIVPTDLVAYTCGVLKTDFRKFLAATAVGMVISYAYLIFLGTYVISLFR